MRYIGRIIKWFIIVVGAFQLALTTIDAAAEDYPLWFLIMVFVILGIALPLILRIGTSFSRAMFKAGLVYGPVYRITEKADAVTSDWFSKIFILGGVFTPMLCLVIAGDVILACIVSGIGLVGDGVILSASRRRLLKSLTPSSLLYLE